jgi:hypothetical protein
MTAAPFTHVAESRNWLSALRRYFLFAAVAHLIWEFAHMPLYMIWLTGTSGELVFAAVHCTGGDILITLSTFFLALLLFGRPMWPQTQAPRVLLAVLIFGVGYTIFSEWLNIEIREAWAYRDLMPVIPVIDAGLSPILQWIVIPIAAYSYALGRMPWRLTAEEAAHG